MKKIVTVFGCLLFTAFGLCIPAYAASASKLAALNTSLFSITSSSFYAIFIAVVAVFFLLGLIIGFIANPRRKLKKNEEKSLAEDLKNNTEETKDLGQDINRNQTGQTIRSSPRNNGYRYYNNYFNYPNSPPRY